MNKKTKNKPDNNQGRFSVRLRGTRGSLACPGAEFEKAGGNTCCIEVNCGNRLMIFDAGSGIRKLGEELVEDATAPMELDLFLTHGHYDHVEGLPFFLPFYCDKFTINIWAGNLEGSSNTSDLLSRIMSKPCFPVGQEVFSANISYHQISPDQTLELGDGITIQTTSLNHPGGATGYRVEFGGKAFSCITDTEHCPGNPDANVIKLAKQADLVFYDATFVEEEMEKFKGFGHSTWEEAARICKLADARLVLAGHHSPFRNDDQIDATESRIAKLGAAVKAAREGTVFQL